VSSGCGTGIWLIELEGQQDLPQTAKMVGLDINPNLFPAPEWLPGRIKLHKLDILDSNAIPDDWVGAFDVVNARLLNSLF